MDAGTFFILFIMLFVAFLMLIIGIFQMRSKKPVGFYAGEKGPDEIELTDTEYLDFVRIIKKGILSNFMGENFTGIVIAGYGDAEYFPSLYRTEVHLILQGIIKIGNVEEIIIGKSF